MSAKVDVLSYQNDMISFKSKDDVMTLLIHLGYLCYDAEAETAITQIKNKKYPDGLSQLSADEKIILVGISYEKDGKEGDKKHTCRIEVL